LSESIGFLRCVPMWQSVSTSSKQYREVDRRAAKGSTHGHAGACPAFLVAVTAMTLPGTRHSQDQSFFGASLPSVLAIRT
jgi:hypothetical protein